MRGLVKTVRSAALVIIGFFVVFFAVSKATNSGAAPQSSQDFNGLGDVAHADAPASGSDSSGSAVGDGGGDSSGSGK
jgi:hypothetical protein